MREIRFSEDGSTLVGFRVKPLRRGPIVGDSLSIVLQTPRGKELWATPPKRLHRERYYQVEYAGDTVEAVTSQHIYNFDLMTGQLRRKVSRYYKRPRVNENKSPDGSKIYSPFEVIDSQKRPTRRYQVGVFNTRNSVKLWSYPVTSRQFELACYPRWEEGGKALATIENNTLLLRDSQTGKTLVRYEGHLPAPLKSWVFTKERDAVYLMDAKGEIFRQRLR